MYCWLNSLASHSLGLGLRIFFPFQVKQGAAKSAVPVNRISVWFNEQGPLSVFTYVLRVRRFLRDDRAP